MIARRLALFGLAAPLALALLPANAAAGWGSGRCGASSAKLQIQWTGSGSLDGEASAPSEFFGLSADGGQKPLLVVVYGAEEDLETFNGFVTKDERVAIGAKAFHAVKIAADRIPAGAAAAEDLGGEAFPRVVVFDAGGKAVGALEGNVTPSKLYDLMGRAAGSKLARFVKEYTKVLTAFDKVENAKEVLKLKKERLGERAERDRSIAAKERELEAASTKINEQEQKLLEKLTA